jgi:hypothetical protein
MKTRGGSPRAPFDLFGEIPVTWDEVYQWISAVAGIRPDSWRAGYYIEHWNVLKRSGGPKSPIPSTTSYRPQIVESLPVYTFQPDQCANSLFETSRAHTGNSTLSQEKGK